MSVYRCSESRLSFSGIVALGKFSKPLFLCLLNVDDNSRLHTVLEMKLEKQGTWSTAESGVEPPAEAEGRHTETGVHSGCSWKRFCWLCSGYGRNEGEGRLGLGILWMKSQIMKPCHPHVSYLMNQTDARN